MYRYALKRRLVRPHSKAEALTSAVDDQSPRQDAKEGLASPPMKNEK